jgi:nucleotide-binding universal stress UspA family protein
MTQTILVPFDGSHNSIKAVHFAISMASSFGDSITLINVQPSFETYNTKRFFSAEDIRDYQQQIGMEILEQAISLIKENRIPYTHEILTGQPKAEIIELAKQLEARCIVMGAKGKGAIKGAIIGSVNYGVLSGAPCPVVTVPDALER